MRNLKLKSHKVTKYNANADFNFLCVDSITKEKYIINKEGVFHVHEDNECPFLPIIWKNFEIIISKIIGADIIPSLNSICVISLDGDVITISLEDQSVDIVGSVSDGIEASVWSPDQELLTLVTGKLNVILMTVDFEPISELSLEENDFGQNKFINVGWGKKETQFHGSEGKQAATQIKKVSSSIFEWDTKAPKISWRGDGQLFAVSYVTTSNIRKIRIIDREGCIQSTSEDIEGLEEPISWKPTGSLIASIQRLSNKHNVIFFEKNGLQHGHFTLPFNATEVKIKEVLWNSDSSVLSVCIEPFDGTETITQFWKVNNYHWYLKEELRFEEKVVDLKWDPEIPLLMYIVSERYIHDMQFTNCVNASLGTDANDAAQVSVIDGNKLLVTPFSQAIIPPPMSAYEIVFQDQIHSVVYAPSKSEKSIESLNNSLAIEDSGFLEAVDSPGNNSNNFCVFHGDNMITVLTQAQPNEQLSDFGVNINVTCAGGNGFSVKTSVHRVFAQLKVELPNENFKTKHILSSGHLYNWIWITKSSFLCCLVTESKNSVILFDLEGVGTEQSKMSAVKVIDVEDEVVSISSSSDGSVVFLQLSRGQLLKLVIDEQLSVLPFTENEEEIKFPSVCDEVILFRATEKKYIPLGLTTRNRLYFGNNQLLSDCTSLYLHNNHILLTTTTHQLLVVPLSTEALNSLSDKVRDEYSKVGIRKLERGSRIVRAVPGDTKVLFQMPRGNLEVINPRPLLIHKLKMLLDHKNYGLAIDVMRKHRINMNMIYDHDPKEFLASLNEFILDIDNPHMIDLFITSLNDECPNKSVNVENLIYPSLEETVELNKKDTVCSMIREAMEKIDKDKYLLPIISTYVKSSKNQLDQALLMLKEMKANQGIERKVSFSDGLRHLMYVADSNELCDIALGMYDFELIMMVYGSSQKDPKEYLPFLNGLWRLEENYRKYKINVHLKRYDKAIMSMELCDQSYNEEFLSLIKKEVLYDESLQKLSYPSNLYFTVCASYGDYLVGKGYLNEAAAMYSRGKKLEKAFEVYSSTDNWKRILITAFELKYSKEKLNSLYCSLVEKLKDKGSYKDAALIYDKYIQSEEDAVECFCKASQFEDAFLVSSKYGRDDLIDTLIKPAIVEKLKALDEDIQNKLLRFKTNLNRLVVVRKVKRREYLDIIERNDSYMDGDLYSDSSTVTGFTSQRSNISKPMSNASLTSGKTYRSSKNKRKLDRKKYSTKEGSTNEDLGIIILLHDLMSSVPPLTEEISDFNRILLLFPGYESYGRLFQSQLSTLIKEMQKYKYTIWPNCAPVEEDAIEFGPQMTAEGVAKQMAENGIKEIDFIIKRMEELEPNYRYPPNIDRLTNWKLYSLKISKEL